MTPTPNSYSLNDETPVSEQKVKQCKRKRSWFRIICCSGCDAYDEDDYFPEDAEYNCFGQAPASDNTESYTKDQDQTNTIEDLASNQLTHLAGQVLASNELDSLGGQDSASNDSKSNGLAHIGSQNSASNDRKSHEFTSLVGQDLAPNDNKADGFASLERQETAPNDNKTHGFTSHGIQETAPNDSKAHGFTSLGGQDSAPNDSKSHGVTSHTHDHHYGGHTHDTTAYSEPHTHSVCHTEHHSTVDSGHTFSYDAGGYDGGSCGGDTSFD